MVDLTRQQSIVRLQCFCTVQYIKTSSSKAHSKAKEEGSHRARRGDPLQLDVTVDVGGVTGEGKPLTPSKNHSFVGVHLDCRRSDGDCKDKKNNNNN